MIHFTARQKRNFIEALGNSTIQQLPKLSISVSVNYKMVLLWLRVADACVPSIQNCSRTAGEMVQVELSPQTRRLDNECSGKTRNSFFRTSSKAAISFVHGTGAANSGLPSQLHAEGGDVPNTTAKTSIPIVNTTLASLRAAMPPATKRSNKGRSTARAPARRCGAGVGAGGLCKSRVHRSRSRRTAET